MKTIPRLLVCTLLTGASTHAYAGGGSTCLAEWCSRMYIYQKKECVLGTSGIPSCSYSDTSYEWCVQKWGSSPAGTYGELEVWDDDRIKAKGGTLESGKCRSRSNSCKHETVQLDLSEAYRC